MSNRANGWIASGSARRVHEWMSENGACFFMDLVQGTGMLRTQVETALGRVHGLFEGEFEQSTEVQLLLRPDEYGVLAMPNLNGDYMSDAAAAQGSNRVHTDPGVFSNAALDNGAAADLLTRLRAHFES